MEEREREGERERFLFDDSISEVYPYKCPRMHCKKFPRKVKIDK
jgi:hypothetical protein